MRQITFTAALLLAVAPVPGTATSIRGSVIKAESGKVTIAIDGTLLPNPGDPVRIFFKVPGLDDEIAVGSGKIISADENGVAAEITQSQGQPQAVQIVVIESAKPRQAGQSLAAPTPEPTSSGTPAATPEASPPPTPPPPTATPAPAPSPTASATRTPAMDGVGSIFEQQPAGNAQTADAQQQRIASPGLTPLNQTTVPPSIDGLERAGEEGGGIPKEMLRDRTPSIPASQLLFTDQYARVYTTPAGADPVDNKYGGTKKAWYMPLLQNTAGEPIGARVHEGNLENPGYEYAGVMFSDESRGKAIDLGQNLIVQCHILFSKEPKGVSCVGPFFRGAAAKPGNSFSGPDAAGFWVYLMNSGQVRVSCLNPPKLIGVTGAVPAFKPYEPHQLQAWILGSSLVVFLDGKRVEFIQDNRHVSILLLPRTKGRNAGSAGIAFGATDNPGKENGPRVEDIIVARCVAAEEPDIRPNNRRPEQFRRSPIPAGNISRTRM